MITITNNTHSQTEKGVLTIKTEVIITCRGLVHTIDNEITVDAKDSYKGYAQSRKWIEDTEKRLFLELRKL